MAAVANLPVILLAGAFFAGSADWASGAPADLTSGPSAGFAPERSESFTSGTTPRSPVRLLVGAFFTSFARLASLAKGKPIPAPPEAPPAPPWPPLPPAPVPLSTQAFIFSLSALAGLPASAGLSGSRSSASHDGGGGFVPGVFAPISKPITAASSGM
jgi:hypothetical protein